MKRLVIALAAGAAIFGAVFALAASLNVTSNFLQAGSDDTAANFQCDADGVNTSYTVAWDSADNRFEVTQVTVSNIDSACTSGAGATVHVQLTDGGTGVGGGSASGVTTSSVTIAVSSPNPAAADVDDVHVAITKP